MFILKQLLTFLAHLTHALVYESPELATCPLCPLISFIFSHKNFTKKNQIWTTANFPEPTLLHTYQHISRLNRPVYQNFGILYTGLHFLSFSKSQEEDLMFLKAFSCWVWIFKQFFPSTSRSPKILCQRSKNNPKWLFFVSVNAEDNKQFQCYVCVKFF